MVKKRLVARKVERFSNKEPNIRDVESLCVKKKLIQKMDYELFIDTLSGV